jgi:Cu/Zn superoxide dismutase
MVAKQGAKVFEVDLASSTTLTSNPVDLGGHTWDHVALEVPSFTSGGTIYVQGAKNESDTFHRIHVMDPADGAQNVLQISQASSAGGHYHMPALAPYQYIKVEVTTTITDATTTFKFHVS